MIQKDRVLITGSFNILHPGHLRLFKFAKQTGKKLYVGVLSDKLIPERAYLSQKDRLESVKSISLVDNAFLINDSVQQTIKKLRPAVIVKGKEHEKLNNIEIKELQKYGGKLIFSSGESTYSSYSLIKNDIFNNIELEKSLLEKFSTKHNINKKTIIDKIRSFSKLKICVIGDLIIDEYIHCDTLGLSREQPSIVVSPTKNDLYLGGAGIVASHAASLGAKVDFISVSGKDNERKFALKKLKEYGLTSKVFIDENRKTSLKQRFITDKKIILKVSHLNQLSISEEIQRKLLNYVQRNIKSYDLIIFSDFNYGVLPQELVDKITDLGLEEKICMTADSQTSSQIGDISRFKFMDLLTPTEREIRLSLKNNQDGLVVIADKLIELSHAKNIILTLGQEGVLVHASNKKFPIFTDQLETLNLNPLDPSGAGDSLLVGASLCLASGGSIWESTMIGSLMSSIQISRMGNIPIRQKDLLRKLH
tara:strand:- start:36974 stop:38407 length:1434 start_codon:yes stop_codon:yes gene_type:complete